MTAPGGFSVVKIGETEGIFAGVENVTVDDVAAGWEKMNDEADMREPMSGTEQGQHFIAKAAQQLGIEL